MSHNCMQLYDSTYDNCTSHNFAFSKYFHFPTNFKSIMKNDVIGHFHIHQNENSFPLLIEIVDKEVNLNYKGGLPWYINPEG